MSIRSLSYLIVAVTLVIFASGTPKTARAQQVIVTGPPLDIVQQKPDYMHKDLGYCRDLFIREPATQWTKTIYLSFHYRNPDNTIGHDEVPLDDITVIIVQDDSARTPKGKMTGRDGGNNIWQLLMTKQTYDDNSSCLAGIPTQTGTI